MRRRTKWIALGLVVAMCGTATVGAVSMAEEQSDSVETVSGAEAVEAEAPEAEVTEEEIQETEAAEEAESTEETEAEAETEAAEDAEAETEAESEMEETVIEYVAIPYDTEDVWEQIAITNSDLVDTALNIRASADEDGEILGFLYKGAAVWVIEKGDDWTEVYSNGLTGYVQSDYLLFGDDVSEIADFYSAKGVRADWDGVIVYSSTEDLTEMGEMNTGDSYPVVNDQEEHWVEIQYDEDETGYVSADDVSFVMLFESATPKDGERIEVAEIEEESTEDESEAEDADEEESEDSEKEEASTDEGTYEASSNEGTVYYEESYSSGSSSSYTTPSYDYSSSSSSSSGYSSSSYDSSYSYSDSSSSYSSSDSGSSSSYTVTETEAAVTVEDTSSEVGTTSSSTYNEGGYYDANTDTYYDENGIAIDSYSYYVEEDYEYDDYYDDDDDEYYDEYYEDEYYYEEDDYTVSESDYYVEDYYEESYSEGVSYSSDDSTLMASLIYCEAGNQPYEGMVAVGAVVMNRVDSSAFPDTISDVVYQSGQFTPAYNGMLDSALSTGVGDVYYSAADDAMSGVDPTDGALYFNTTHGSGLQIGDHWFY